MAASSDGVELPIAKPKAAPATVMREKVAVKCARGIRSPVIAFNMVVKAAAKKTSKGSSAMAFETKYSRLEYMLRICSRSTTGRSLANKLIVFINAIFMEYTIFFEMNIFSTIHSPGTDTTYIGTHHGHINNSKR